MTNDVFEIALLRAKSGFISSQTLLWTMAASSLLVATPDSTYDGDLSNLKPLLLRGNGCDLLAVFTSSTRLGRFTQIVDSFVPMRGIDIVMSMPQNAGIVINPESNFGFELPSEGVAALREELRIPIDASEPVAPNTLSPTSL